MRRQSRRCALLLGGLAGVFLLACSDNTPPAADAAADLKRPRPDWYFVPEFGPDLFPPADLPPTAVCDPASIGDFCTFNGDCNQGKGMLCLLTGPGGSAGVCTCKCQPKTTSKPDSCPDQTAGNLCVTVQLSGGQTQGYCMRKCSPRLGSSDCRAKVSCDPSSASNLDLKQPVCAYPGCLTDAECPVGTGVVCSVQKADCPAGETCAAVLKGFDEGRCQRSGKCDLPSGLCAPHSHGTATAAVGDPCNSDLDCAGHMQCAGAVDEAIYYKKTGAACTKDSECCSRTCDSSGFCTKAVCAVLRRNGYCTVAGCEFADTLTQRACPAGSACNLRYFSGYCQKICDLNKPEDCRGRAGELFGDYECRRWGNIPGYMKTDLPVCDFGTQVRCSFFKGSGLSCSIFGADPGGKLNPTNMRCRTLDGKDTVDPFDPTGYCLDDSGSGTGYRNPMPQP